MHPTAVSNCKQVDLSWCRRAPKQTDGYKNAKHLVEHLVEYLVEHLVEHLGESLGEHLGELLGEHIDEDEMSIKANFSLQNIN